MQVKQPIMEPDKIITVKHSIETLIVWYQSTFFKKKKIKNLKRLVDLNILITT